MSFTHDLSTDSGNAATHWAARSAIATDMTHLLTAAKVVALLSFACGCWMERLISESEK